jgi:hypothetical protein
MSFFDQPPPEAPDEHPARQPEWSAPPENVVGASVPFDLVLADRVPAETGGPTLMPRGGGGGGLTYEFGYWLWPLPPAGPLRFACAWPDEGIEETTAELDAAIRDAAARAVELWPDDRPIVS